METPDSINNTTDSGISDTLVLKLENCYDNTSDLIITQEMVEVEKKMQEKTVEEEEHLIKQMEEEREKEDLKEQRYKTLMHLLTRSKFYTDFMLKKLEETQQKVNSKPRYFYRIFVWYMIVYVSFNPKVCLKSYKN
ncbi:hypothetical protein C0J52_19698 [Blattella germanica]|nr:hypothetical protein C0J52_19698 [Blattella germanica]